MTEKYMIQLKTNKIKNTTKIEKNSCQCRASILTHYKQKWFPNVSFFYSALQQKSRTMN